MDSKESYNGALLLSHNDLTDESPMSHSKPIVYYTAFCRLSTSREEPVIDFGLDLRPMIPTHPARRHN